MFRKIVRGGNCFPGNYQSQIKFEVGSDYKISIAALLGYLQDTALNHHKRVGLLTDGFGSSTRMMEMNTIRIMYWSHIEVDCYISFVG
ncbi:Acyl-[acyl-carrier-protein] hydrolase [Melia azedarach]|uniref:Acyl-[acyl-carrier-protein] hydrolase n=1 Tax=Melia azedarach TaxID=155640 RepID=A0ACC1Y495_MELAZ|nr:Acyl-[acyl-carrier-protein] hydrolase [Melia azedarach]